MYLPKTDNIYDVIRFAQKTVSYFWENWGINIDYTSLLGLLTYYYFSGDYNVLLVKVNQTDKTIYIYSEYKGTVDLDIYSSDTLKIKEWQSSVQYCELSEFNLPSLID